LQIPFFFDKAVRELLFTRMTIKSFCLLTLVMQLVVSFSFALVCEEGPPGLYCTDDMMGFHDCTWTNGYYRNRVVQCPQSTRCNCFLERKCKSSEDPCQVYYPPDPLDSVYTMQLKGQEKIEHSYGLSVRKLSATWSYDQVNRKSMKSRSDGTFKLVLPNQEGSFDVFDGNYDGYCRKSTESKFSNLIDLEFYRFMGPEIMQIEGVNVVTQKWGYARGRRHSGQELNEKDWLFEKERSGMPMRPVRSSERNFGTPSQRTNTYSDFDVTSFHTSVSQDAFYIPDICQNS